MTDKEIMFERNRLDSYAPHLANDLTIYGDGSFEWHHIKECDFRPIMSRLMLDNTLACVSSSKRIQYQDIVRNPLGKPLYTIRGKLKNYT